MALDPGSARTRAWLSGTGAVLDVPTVAGAAQPVRRGTIVDPPACARMLEQVLTPRVPRGVRPMVIVTTPVLDGVAFRAHIRTALDVLRPRSVLTVPAARAVAVAAGADLSRPLMVVDLGAQLTEAVLLGDGAIVDARRTPLGTGDLDAATPPGRIAEAVAEMLTAMLRQDRSPLTLDALHRGVLLAGGGALRPEIIRPFDGLLHAPPRVVPAPHTAAVRGAAQLLASAHAHPCVAGPLRAGAHPH
ncbi:rod shape-determining protein [Streptomyces sp. NPDC050418]|uniref:rod shape-determining protein n=1 Tax=Streptomyces sp. NPDC050418 TaxID=3365612 RepID=UPI0037AA4356